MQPLSPQLPATSENVLNKRKGVASTLRIQAPAQFPQIALALGDSNPSTLSSADSDLPPFDRTAAQRSAKKNMKKLSLNLPSAQSSMQSLSSTDFPPTSREKPRRPSIASLPAISLFHRRDEDPGSPIPYADGPVQVIPGIWIGSEDNARDWKGLLERRIRSILNVAKEVSSPFDAFPASQALRSVTSTPNFRSRGESDVTYYPPHVPSGRPGMHYLKLDWSHGQQDLVDHGFKDAMAFVDAALDRGEGCLIHCQCGISRSATMVIALVMRAAAERRSSVPPDIWALQGMQAAYDYVKEKSPCVGPNMSLIYQLLEYEKALKRSKGSPHDSDTSSIAEDEEEWTRRRRLLDEAPDHDQNDRESITVMQEARALDKAMEDRVVARKSSASSMSSIGSASATGMSFAWKSRYTRKRTQSTTSSKTSGSMSEDLVEEEEEEALLGTGGDFDNDSPRTGGDSSSSSPDDEHIGTPRNPSNLSIRLPLTGAAWKSNVTCPSPLTAVRATFDAPFSCVSPPKPKVKQRPVSLGILPPAPPFPVTVETDDLADPKVGTKRIPRPTRRQSESRISRPQSHRQNLILQKEIPTSHSADSIATPAGKLSQTFFVFPPSPTFTSTRGPSTMTLLSNPSFSFPMLQTPRVSTFSSKGKRRSFIGLTSPPAPTVGLAKVDARGYVGFEVSSL